MSSLVIVAVPAEDDFVHKISSEKVPHLTLMYLGEASEDKNVDRIAEFVKHALNVNSHGPFYLDVDYRGELGDDKADVLFFSGGWEAKWIKTLRGQLLKQADIRAAHESEDQFPDWVPHLTLGYPDTPAKKLDDDHRKIYSVEFDRIAVWDGNYEGPEFRLKWDRDALVETHGSTYDGPFAQMSSINQVRAAMGLAVGEGDIEHYGVKGMKWGVRKTREGSARVGATKVGRGVKKVGRGTLHVAKDIAFETEWAKDSARDHIAIQANKKFTNEDLPRLKREYEGTKAATLKGRLKNPLDTNTIQYRARARAAFRDRLNDEVVNYPTNASGTRRYEIEDNGASNTNYFWAIKAVDVKRSSGLERLEHAAKDEEELVLTDFRVRPGFDEDGFIVGLEFVKSEAEHSVLGPEDIITLGADFLEHYGVKGMKWGVRKAEFQEGVHNRRVTAETVRREKRPARDIRAYPTIGKSKRRKSEIATKGGEDHPPTQDAIKVAEARQKIKKSGLHAVSNDELREVATRLNLEQQVLQLEAKRGNRTSMGRKFVEKLLKDKGAKKKVGKLALKSLTKRRR